MTEGFADVRGSFHSVPDCILVS